MKCKEAVKKAVEIIGEKTDSDYVISPSNHKEKYEDKSSVLNTILESTRLKSIARRYENKDYIALEAQKKFRRVFKRVNITILVTAFIISAILSIGVIAKDTNTQTKNYAIGLLGIGSLIAGGLATKDFYIIKRGELLESWMSKRAKAETLRLEYFEKFIDESMSCSDDPDNFICLLKLEYFNRYQLQVQLDFYRKRSMEHHKNASRYLSLSGWATFGSAIAAGSATFGIIQPELTALAALGVIFTAFSSYASVHEGVYQYRRNSERYDRTLEVLEKLFEELDTVRLAIYELGFQPLSEYVDAFHEQLSLEHRQWIGQLNKSRGAFARMEITLNKIKAKNS